MKKTLKGAAYSLTAIITLFTLLIAISCVIYPPSYIFRILVNLESDVNDYKIFESRLIEKSKTPFVYDTVLDDSYSQLSVKYTYENKEINKPLQQLLADSKTSSFIVIKNDKLVYEKYFHGYERDSVFTSFSSVKSLVSLMIGIAIDDGYIKSEDQLITDFIPEFKDTEFNDITIKELLLMRSKIKYEEGNAWFGDDAKTYYYPDLRGLALNHMKVDKDYSGKFHYNNYHPLLLGIIIERSTGVSVSEYFRQKIWDKVGAEIDASWSLDSKKTGFEKMESGLNFRALDYAKIGSMMLHRGKWNNNTIISQNWLDRAIFAPEALRPDDIDSEFLVNKKVGYQYMWYSIPNDKGGKDFFASGKYGQLLYISPENNTVIVRTGIAYGSIDYWPYILRQLAAK